MSPLPLSLYNSAMVVEVSGNGNGLTPKQPVSPGEQAIALVESVCAQIESTLQRAIKRAGVADSEAVRLYVQRKKTLLDGYYDSVTDRQLREGMFEVRFN